MAHEMKPWFAPKRYGYGSGLPIAWQGWAVLAIFAVGVWGAATRLQGPWKVLALGGLIIALIVITGLKTEGGWRWRWGRDR